MYIRSYHNFFLSPLFFIFIIIIFWLLWVFVAVRGLSLVVANGGYSLLQCVGFSLGWLLLLWSAALGVWASLVMAHDLVAPPHVGSSQTRDRTHVPGIGRWILNNCTTREVPITIFFLTSLLEYNCFTMVC